MLSRERRERRRLRSLGIGILILGAVHIPLPQADYHNIRHHDAPGEVCLYHDHLLRWHPSARSADDVAMLHWHWFVPLVDPGADQPGGDDEDRPAGSRPAVHAHLGDWPEPDWRGEPVIRPDRGGRFLTHLVLGHSGTSSVGFAARVSPHGLEPGSTASGPPHAWVGLRAERTAMFQRWNC